MREIIFRGKRIDNDHWIKGSLIIEPNLPEFKSMYSDVRNAGKSKYLIYPFDAKDGRAIEVIPETVGQYIGSYDKNGKEYYEGDISVSKNTLSGEQYEVPFLVYWDEYKRGWALSNKRYENPTWSFDAEEEEIIGNITDNPELLEGN